MSSVNKVILVGRLGRDPETRTTSGGTSVSNFSIATDEKWKDAGGELQSRTEWHDIVAWGKLADTCARFLTKGKQVYIEGKLQTREWDDKEGNKRRKTEIVAQQVTFLGSSGSGAGRGEREPGDEEQPTLKASGSSRKSTVVTDDNPITDDDIPF